MRTLLIVLLVGALLCSWLSLFGLVVMRNAYDRLHAIAPANLLPPILVAAALIIANGFSINSLKALTCALLLSFGGPLLTHAIARAARLREEGKIAPNE